MIYNYNRPDFPLPYRSGDDTPPSLPLAPRNVNVTSPYLIGIIDVRWDNPATYAENNSLYVLGTNVYKSYDSPEGPYTKLNTDPIGIPYYRDQTTEQYVTEDPVQGGRLIPGTTANGLWVAKTYNTPLVIPGSNGTIANNPKYVRVDIKKTAADQFVTVPAFRVVGEDGEIFLISSKIYNNRTNRLDDPILPDLSKGGEIRISYTYINNLIQTDIFRKIYYKVSTVAYKTGCTDATIETPLEQVEAFSPYDIEKIDWIWAEAIRRNKWILEQGGERVKLFVRKWSGIRCTCWDEQYRQGKEDDPLCFHPGTPVRTINGWESIENIKIGDSVLASDGLYHKVLNTFENDFSGELVSILPNVSTQPILATPNHPFMVLRGNHLRKKGCSPECDGYIKEGDGFIDYAPNARQIPSGNWWARVQMYGERGVGRITLGTYATKEEAIKVIQDYRNEHYKPGHILQWDEASNISDKDWLNTQWYRGEQDISEIEVPEEFLKISNYGPKRLGSTKFVVDEDFLWMIGMYIAEGSNGLKKGTSGVINFALHVKETEYQNRLIKIFKRYGYNSTLVKRDGFGVCVEIYSTTLSKWFPKLLGHLCYNKHIPNEFMYLPKNKLWALIQGIYDGDGSKREHEIGQTSEILAMQLVELLHRVGEKPLVRKFTSKKLTPKGNIRKICYYVNWAEDSLVHINRKGRWIYKDKELSKVRKVDRVFYVGKVYNIKVEGDPSYVVNGVVVHNCYGTSYLGGYSKPYDIIVAPPEADKIVNLGDIGLRVNYNWASWTGPYPLLTSRDFIVRQNNDRFSIDHINAQGSRGAIYQQHFELAQLPQHDIRYKVPITGGETSVPPAWNAYRESRPTDASPVINDKPGIPEQYQVKGRTPTFENIMF